VRPLLCLALVALVALAACGGGAPAPSLVPAARAAALSAEWWNGAVVYEVFVRSFRDSDGDGKGDLAGLISKLDYLNDGDPATATDLGIDAIWLMPIHPSPSYHGYDVTDYDGVNPDYGSSATMDTLIAECHKRGIKVILDFVPNHTSIQHPWFVDSATSVTSSHRDWYVWTPTNPGWTQPWGTGPTWYQVSGSGPWYYVVFWSGMPDLNWRNAAVRAEMDGIAGHWLTRGVDGFRLDAVRYLIEEGPGLQQDRPETHTCLGNWTAGVLAANPHAMVVGESWADCDRASVGGGREHPRLAAHGSDGDGAGRAQSRREHRHPCLERRGDDRGPLAHGHRGGARGGGRGRLVGDTAALRQRNLATSVR